MAIRSFKDPDAEAFFFNGTRPRKKGGIVLEMLLNENSIC